MSWVEIHPDTLDHQESRIRQRHAVMAGLTESGYLPSEPNRLYFHSSSCLNGDKKEFDIRWEYYNQPKESQSDIADIAVIWIDKKVKYAESNSPNKNCLSLSKLADFNKNDSIYEIDLLASFYLKDLNSPKPEEKNKKFDTKALAAELAKELFVHRRITKPTEIAIITEQETENIRELGSLFCQSFSKKIPEEEKGCSEKIRSITYQKGLDAYLQTTDKQNQNKDDQSATKRNDRLSIIDHHNPPIGSARFDYLHRLAVEIKNTHKKPDPKQRINAVGVFGSDFHDKLLIFQALRKEMPNIVLFTTDLDAQMSDPEHWRWTRNLIVASHFDLKLKEAYQKQSPPFRDSQQTALYYATLIAAGNDKLAEKEVSPLIFEIGRNGPVPLSAIDSGQSVHPDYDNSTQLQTIWILSILMTLVLILFLLRILPSSGILIGWLIVTTIIFYGSWLIALVEADAPFSLTDGTSLWPTILIRIIACSLVLLFFLKSVVRLETNFDRLNRRYFGDKTELKTLFQDQDDIFFQIKKIITDSLAKRSGKSSEINEPEWFLKFFAANLILISIILYQQHAISSAVKADFFVLIAIYLSALLWLFLLPSSGNSKLDNKIFTQFFVTLLIILLNILSLALSDFPKEIIIASLFWLTFSLFSIAFNDPNFKRIKIKSWAEEDAPSKIAFLKNLWKQYHSYGRPWQRLVRMTGMWLFFVTTFVILESMLPILLPVWPSPCRGTSCGWDLSLQTISFIVIMFLVIFVLDAVGLCFYWIKILRSKHPLLVDWATLESPQDQALYIKERNKKESLESLEVLVILVAKRTHAIDWLIYYPLITMMLMLFARINYFHNLDFPLAIGITFAISMTLLFYAGFKLRSEAELLRIAVINCAEKFAKNSSQNDANATIQRIRSINYGAFYPMLEQPVMRGLLLILASVGLFAGEYLMIFGSP